MKLFLKIILCWGLGVTGCAPKVTDFRFPTANQELRPEGKDIPLRLREFGDHLPELFWHETVSTASLFDQAENLIKLGDQAGRPELRQKGLFWIRRFYQAPQSTLMADFATGPYIQLATAHAEPEVRKSLDEVLLKMSKALPVILRHVHALGRGSKPGGSKGGLEGLLQQAEEFNRRLLAEIPHMRLPKVIEEGFRSELIKTTEPLFAEVRRLLRAFKRVKTLAEALNLLEGAVVKFKVTLSPELSRNLKQGQSLARGLDKIHDAQGALTVIVDLWRMLTPQERAQKIKPASRELYNFLSRQDAKELDCLRTRGCLGGVVDGVVKKMFVLPRIDAYGVKKLKAEINQKTLESVTAAIASYAHGFIDSMPQTFAENIETAWNEKVQRMIAVQQDLLKYVARVVGRWSKKTLSASRGQIPGFEASAVKVNISTRTKFSVLPVMKPLELNGEVAGSSLSASVFLLENAPVGDERGFQSALSQINKLVAMSGYYNTEKQLVPALLAPVNHDSKFLDILNFEEVEDVRYSFRLPNQIFLKDPFHADSAKDYPRDFSVSALSAQIKGLSSLLRFTADWRVSSFDSLLGPIKVQDLTQDAQDPALQQPLFPKDMLFALNVGTTAVLLQDLIKVATPIFLLTLEDQILWGNQFSDQSEETVVMAGLVDIQNRQRVKLVKAREVAKFILALGEFLSAIEGVENTKSIILLEKNSKGVRPLDNLQAGRRELKRLCVALSNFLSNKMKSQEADLVSSYYSLESKGQVGAEIISVETQAHAIRALVKAYEISGIEAYLWSAEEIYYGMNRRLYDLNKGFYLDSDGRDLLFPEKVHTLRALSDIKPYLPGASQRQLQKILDPWLAALAALKDPS